MNETILISAPHAMDGVVSGRSNALELRNMPVVAVRGGSQFLLNLKRKSYMLVHVYTTLIDSNQLSDDLVDA